MNIRRAGSARGAAISALILVLASTGGSPAIGRTPKNETPESLAAARRLATILQTFDETQAATRTLTAAFTERKEIALLKEPVVSKGLFYYTKPDDVLWQYVEPDPRYFVISKNELLSYVPAKKKAEKVSIGLYRDRLLKVLAIGQPSKNLMKYYDLRLEEAGNDVPETHLLVLKPRKRTVKKRIQEVRLWVSRDRCLPLRMQYREPDGDSTTIVFEDVRFNPEIAASVYRISIPKDVQIRRGFSGMTDKADKDQG